MIGTTRTEKRPPVTMPAPYNMSQSPGINAAAPERSTGGVRRAPTRMGRPKLKANFRLAPVKSGRSAARAFRAIARAETRSASKASPTHTQTHRDGVGWRAAIHAAASAVTPTRV